MCNFFSLFNYDPITIYDMDTMNKNMLCNYVKC